MMSLILMVVVGCLGLLIVAGLVVGLIYIMQSSRRDTVSSARENWINTGNEEDDGE